MVRQERHMGWFSSTCQTHLETLTRSQALRDGEAATITNANAEDDLSSIKSSIDMGWTSRDNTMREACLRTRRLLFFNEGLQSAKNDVEKYY